MRSFDQQPDNQRRSSREVGRNRSVNSRRTTRLRIVAGQLGSRRIEYNGDPATRPMKEKTREAVFSLLGGYLDDSYAIDLFAGTGILGFEAISRGSSGATLLEMSRPTVSSILANMRSLDLSQCVDVQNVDTLRWLRQAESQTVHFPRSRWIIFCCPPYALWRDQTEAIVAGLVNLIRCAPVDSQLVCEYECSFDLVSLMPQLEWDVREYKPALVSIARRPEH